METANDLILSTIALPVVLPSECGGLPGVPSDIDIIILVRQKERESV